MSKKFSMPYEEDDLDVLDLDEEDTEYEETDNEEYYEAESEEEYIEEYAEEEYTEETDGNIGDEEFMEEEPYVVPVTEEMYAMEEDMSSEMAEEYDEAEEAFERGEHTKGKREERGAMPSIFSRIAQMETMDKIIMSLGCVVLLLAIVAVSVFMSYRTTENQILTFAHMGEGIEGVSLIGESGLLAVTDATMAKIDALNESEEEEQEEEKENPAASIVVKMNFTSIQKDLKIKFTNKKTGKLIAGIPFEVEVKTPSGKTQTWSDEDKDGIIYYKNITDGKYYITLKELEGKVYERYVLDTTTQTATVKKEIDYVQVDVSDEIMDESEIDASKEDTEQGNAVESALSDTVKYVSPNKIPAGKDYVEIKKTDIVAPTTSAMLTVTGSGSSTVMFAAALPGRINRMPVLLTAAGGIGENESGGTETAINITMSQSSASVEAGKTLVLTATVTGTENTAVTWTSSKPDVATVENGTVTGLKEGETVITAVSSADSTKSATCTVTVTAPVQQVQISLSSSGEEVEIDKTITLTATVTGTENITVTWTSSKPDVATVENGTVKGLKAGETVITAVSSADNSKSATCTITVKAKERTVTLDKTKLEMTVGEEKTLKATVEGYTDASKGKVEWTTADKTIATVDENGKITALKEGKVKITASNTENDKKIEASCEVTVKAATNLKTKNGEDVYVKKDDKFVKATATDYENADSVFYIYTDSYKYQGWTTIDGKKYYYTEDYKKVTGEQVIMGVKYVFDSDGVLQNTTGVMGIDVSKWNGTIDWSKVKAAGIDYVIIRCGYRGSSKGALIEDPKYKANIDGATKAGLKVGVYFFSQAVDEVEAVQEASMVLSLVKGYKITYPIFLDVEASGGRADNISKETRTAICKAFCKTIQNAGYTAGVYANKTWLTNKIDASQLGGYKIWLAQYATQPSYTGRYEIWQYKDSGSVPGISGHVDLNLSYLGY